MNRRNMMLRSMDSYQMMDSYRQMGSYYGQAKCMEVKGLETLASAPVPAGETKEGFDYGNCKIVVPTEASMGYGKIFDHPADSLRYKGYFSVKDGYAPAQSSCGQYRLRTC